MSAPPDDFEYIDLDQFAEHFTALATEHLLPKAMAQANQIGEMMNAMGIRPGMANALALFLLACGNAQARPSGAVPREVVEMLFAFAWEALASNSIGHEMPKEGTPS